MASVSGKPIGGVGFSSAFTKWLKKAQDNADKVLREVGLEGGKELLENSPVKSGRFRRNWKVRAGAPNLNFDMAIPRGGPKSDPTTTGFPATEAELEEVVRVKRAKYGQSLFFTNSLPYGKKVERLYGTLAISVERLRAKIPAIVRRVEKGG